MCTSLSPPILICLSLGTGIFVVLSLIEQPVWKLMRRATAPEVHDMDARDVHASLQRVIHLLPPVMVLLMLAVCLLFFVQSFATDHTPAALLVPGIFLVQFVPIVIRLDRDIHGVATVSPLGEIGAVRDGLARLVRLHHRGLLMTTTTVFAQWVLLG